MTEREGVDGAAASADVIAAAAVASGAAAYHWKPATDELVWSANAPEILGLPDLAAITTGRGFARFFDPDNAANRYDIVMQSAQTDGGQGVAFGLEYRLKPDGRGAQTTAWVEDQGRWFAGPDGRPADVLGTIRRIDERQKRDERLRFLSDCDSLTGLTNRARFETEISEAIASALASKVSAGLFLLSISNLSVINEAYGFDLADEVVRLVAGRLKLAIRSGEVLARYAGARFGLISRACDEADVAATAERLLQVVRDEFIETSRGPVWIRLSAGAVLLPRHADRPGLAQALAEEALAEARRLPTDGFVLHQPSPERLSLRLLNSRCVSEIIDCLRDNRFELGWQPIVDAATGVAAIHEGLLRMRCHDGEIIPATHLIPVAEQLGLVRFIDQRVVEIALRTLEARPGDRLSINLSAITATDPRWYHQIAELIARNRDMVAGRLVVEITETAVLTAAKEVARFTALLREAGVQIAIDDFGAGHTSLRHLQIIGPDLLKLDGSFCDRLASNQTNQIFVLSLVELAQKFGLKTVAEWVEREEDAALLKSWGVDYLQGFLFGEAQVRKHGPESVPAPMAGPVPVAEPEVFEPQDLKGVLALLDKAFGAQPPEAA